MTFKPLFGQFTYLSLSFVTFRVSRFRVSHLTHETVKLCLQNTLNMSKMTRVYFGVLQRPPMPGYNNSKISHSRCPIILQHVTGQALSQYHNGHPLRLSHGYQIPNCKWSRKGSRKPARSQGVLLNINETKTVVNIYMD